MHQEINEEGKIGDWFCDCNHYFPIELGNNFEFETRNLFFAESKFSLSGKVKKQICQMRGSERPQQEYKVPWDFLLGTVGAPCHMNNIRALYLQDWKRCGPQLQNLALILNFSLTSKLFRRHNDLVWWCSIFFCSFRTSIFKLKGFTSWTERIGPAFWPQRLPDFISRDYSKLEYLKDFFYFVSLLKPHGSQ